MWEEPEGLGKPDPELMAKFNEQYPHLKDFWPFQEIMAKESKRGAVLVSCGFLDTQLRDILLAFLRDHRSSVELVAVGNGPLETFSARITACFALALITTDEHYDLNQLRRVRNDFAHDIHVSFETQSVVDRCKNLKHKAHDYESETLGPVKVSTFGQFQSAAVGLIMNLTNRAYYVRKHQRVEVAWPS